MEEDVASIFEQQKEIGYESTFVHGEKKSFDYMKNIFDDWQAKGITSVLHEKRGGYANNTSSIYGLARKAEDLGVRILTGTVVKGFKSGNGSTAITAVENIMNGETSKDNIWSINLEKDYHEEKEQKNQP